MENLRDYIGVFTQAPLAVILLVFMYLVLKQQTLMINKLSELLDRLVKAIKHKEEK